mgnify:CR=1 FL=1
MQSVPACGAVREWGPLHTDKTEGGCRAGADSHSRRLRCTTACGKGCRDGDQLHIWGGCRTTACCACAALQRYSICTWPFAQAQSGVHFSEEHLQEMAVQVGGQGCACG